jgi:hypothetical protein
LTNLPKTDAQWEFMFDPLFETFLTSRGLKGLRQRGCHKSVKNWIFDDPFHKKLPVLVILVPVMIRQSKSGSRFWGNWASGCRGR